MTQKIGIISGSHRKESQSFRVAKYIDSHLAALSLSRFLFSLAENPLPLWDEGIWAGAENWTKVWGPISKELKSCSSFVVISPEWGGMVPSGLKNFFLLCGKEELAHKPGLIVAVSAGPAGSYPVSELRTSSYKNSRICYIPDHVIVRNVAEMLVGPTAANDRDKHAREQISYSLKLLLEYDKALTAVRSSGVIDLEKFPFGM